MTATPMEHTTAHVPVHTAQVIPFPRRAAAPPASLSSQERLSRALEALNAAIAEQRAAVVAWRGALAQLKASAGGLGQSLETYRGSLQSLGKGVDALQTQAKLLRGWADRPLPTQG